MGINKAALLESADTVKIESVEVDGHVLTIREPTVAEFFKYGQLAGTDRTAANATLIAACVIDENGKPVFSPEEARKIASKVRLALPIVSKIIDFTGDYAGGPEKHPVAN